MPDDKTKGTYVFAVTFKLDGTDEALQSDFTALYDQFMSFLKQYNESIGAAELEVSTVEDITGD